MFKTSIFARTQDVSKQHLLGDFTGQVRHRSAALWGKRPLLEVPAT